MSYVQGNLHGSNLNIPLYILFLVLSSLYTERYILLYPVVQQEEPPSYDAFLRRINDGVWEMLPDSANESV